MLGDKNVIAIQCSNTSDEYYAIFCNDKGLYHGNDKDGFVLLSVLGNISTTDRFIKMYYHYPYICVTERYGVNASVINISSGQALNLKRKDYHSDVSSYSIGFLEREGRVLLIHQTEWNRLDITDLETGELLTEREVVLREANEKGAFKKWEKKNYIDYFHSLLHVSPDYKHFLSNGWIWQPFDNIVCFETERFLKEYEPSVKSIMYHRGYAWDRPCTFVGSDMFVIAADTDWIIVGEGVDETTLKEPPAYHQLLFYKLSEVKAGTYSYNGYENYDTMPLAYSDRAACDVFAFDEYGEISEGELHYNYKKGNLIAISSKGAFELTLDGKIVNNKPDIKQSVANWALRRNDTQTVKHTDLLQNWQYDVVRHSFYRYSENKIETIAFGK